MPGNLRTVFRLAADDADGRVLLLEVARNAHDRPGGAHAADEMGDAAGGLSPQLRAGSLVVRQRIVGVGELVEDDARPFLAHALGDVARQFHAAIARRQHQLGAKGRIVCRRSTLWFSGITRIIR
jgi:hypothetical protein